MSDKNEAVEKKPSVFEVLSAINVNEHVEKKKTGQKNPDGTDKELTYLSWMWAWSYVKKLYPDATYEIIMNEQNLPFFSDPKFGAMVYTKVTIQGETLSMWLPVMDGGNNAMKEQEYDKVITSKYGTKTKHVDGFSMFDINTSVMRCLSKNLAMFGLGSYIYAGEDIPEEPEEVKMERLENERRAAEAEAEAIKQLVSETTALINKKIANMTESEKKAFNNDVLIPIVECRNYKKCTDKSKLEKLKEFLLAQESAA